MITDRCGQWYTLCHVPCAQRSSLSLNPQTYAVDMHIFMGVSSCPAVVAWQVANQHRPLRKLTRWGILTETSETRSKSCQKSSSLISA